MGSNQILDFQERVDIEKYIKKGKSLTEIARILARSKNGIITEVRNNGGRTKYRAKDAEARKDVVREERYLSVSQKLKGHKHNFKTNIRIVALEQGLISLSLEVEKLKKAQCKAALHENSATFPNDDKSKSNWYEDKQPKRTPGVPLLIPVTKWNQYHDWPPIGGLRHLIANRENNGFDAVLCRPSRVWLIDQDKFFEWLNKQGKDGKEIE